MCNNKSTHFEHFNHVNLDIIHRWKKIIIRERKIF